MAINCSTYYNSENLIQGANFNAHKVQNVPQMNQTLCKI